MKIIKLAKNIKATYIIKILKRKRSFNGAGSFGRYFKIHGKKLGIKIIYNGNKTSIIEEFELLNIAKNSGVTPKPYAIVKIDNKFGIIMSHIPGKKQCGYVAQKLTKKSLNKLEQIGFELYDHWLGHNIIINKNRAYIIDLSPTGVLYEKK